ncbi:LysR substrate-binding domain-containing protein [Marinomonas polaris]|jgi:LysR family transcriptional regulator, glycine cleavage system transcriptional activator|uniref:LysR substrate-binding domain-containing protein n=1 Tax=Marinomonas TaxID=28253 RepID=UPI000C1EA8B8|nr:MULTISPECIES: LysR substrate-binding domain-containing protein [unclassified Marinomonas]PJE55494.1 hypothetical protein TY87_10240 [Marinomonas sp. BSi20584]
MTNKSTNPRRLTPSMPWLLAFESAARNLSFTLAAKELSLTQSVISRHIQSLEDLLEVELFHRNGKQLQLNEAGAMYMREVSSGLQRIRNASQNLNTYKSTATSINLACLPTFAAKWLMPRLADFYVKHPNILVHIHAKIRQFNMELEGMDCAISGGGRAWPGMASYPLVKGYLVPVISPALHERVPFNTPSDAGLHTLLQVSTRPDDWFQWFSVHDLSTTNIRLGPQFEMTSHVLQAAIAGIGIALVPSCLVEDELTNGSLIMPFSPSKVDALKYDYSLHITPHQDQSPTVSALREWLLELSTQ